MIVPSPEGNSRRTLLRAISGRRPVSGTVIRLEPERTATAAARRCRRAAVGHPGHHALPLAKAVAHLDADLVVEPDLDGALADLAGRKSEEHTSELQSLMRNSYAVFCLKKKKTHTQHKKRQE